MAIIYELYAEPKNIRIFHFMPLYSILHLIISLKNLNFNRNETRVFWSFINWRKKNILCGQYLLY